MIEDVLDRAVKVFWQKGYEASSLDDLTAAMAINRPSLYAAFGDKAALFSRCLDRYEETIRAPMLLALAEDDVHVAMRRFLEGAAGVAASAATPTGCLIACALPSLAGSDPALEARLGRSVAGLEAAVVQRLARAVRDGQLPGGFPVEDRAAMAADFVLANALRARAGTSRDSLARRVRVCAGAVLTLP
ncbi:MAG: TetR/AcrR family transcriptional regulator [Rhodospirillales bacterium]|nr:TetR/AcrR family transcriptional regulator [Rhodospirillales bacterium]